MIKKYGPAVAICLLLTGCSKYYYNPSPQVLPQHVQRIAIRAFNNKTQQYGLEDKLTLAVQNEFNRDGRFQITTEDQADGVLVGDVTRYILEPLSYDANHVPIQYKLWILIDITFYDKVHQQSLWVEKNLSGELRYYVASSGLPGATTEEEARQTIWDQLARDVRTRTLEGFGTVTGASTKAVPKSDPANASPATPEPLPTPAGGPQPPSPVGWPY